MTGTLFDVPPVPDRPRDLVWDALVSVYGEPETKSARTLLNRVRKELASMDAGEVARRARRARAAFPLASPMILAQRWPQFGDPPPTQYRSGSPSGYTIGGEVRDDPEAAWRELHPGQEPPPPLSREEALRRLGSRGIRLPALEGGG